MDIAEPNNSLSRYFFKKHGLFLLFAAALMFDTLSTMKFMIEGGIDLEIHPLVRLGAFVYGPIVGTFLTAFLYKILAGFAILRFLGKYSSYFLTVSIFSSSFAGFYNIWGHYFVMR